jgi:hypothetical protein
MTTRTDNEPLAKAWGKIIGGDGKFADLGRAGYVPVYDENYQIWRLFRNEHTIYEGAENAADPVKVEGLRCNAVDLMARYPATVERLERLGLRVRTILKTTIKTPEDVANWATSVFNTGPMLNPEHVWHTAAIAYDDFQLRIGQSRGLPPIFVLPAGPRGSGNGATVDFTIPGQRRQFGPRHEYSKTAFASQMPKPVKVEKPVEQKEARPRGRPRRDNLIPGSPEAKTADVARRKEIRKAARAKRKAAAALAPVIQMPTEEEPRPRRHLARRRSS